MNLDKIARGDLLRTAGRTALVVGVRRVREETFVDLAEHPSTAGGPMTRPVTVPVKLLRRLLACGMDVRVIPASRPPRRLPRRAASGVAGSTAAPIAGGSGASHHARSIARRGEGMIVLGVTATGSVALLPSEDFGTDRARQSLEFRRIAPRHAPRQARRRDADRRGPWTKRA